MDASTHVVRGAGIIVGMGSPGDSGKTIASGDDALERETRALFGSWRAGDDTAAARLFELHQPFLRDLVDRELGTKLRGKVEAADVVQELGLKLLRYEPKADDGPVDRFRALCRTMARHVLTDQHRHHFASGKRGDGADRRLHSDSRMALDPPRDSVTSPSGAFARLEDKALARLGVHFLDPPRRDLLAMRWWLDVPFADLVLRFGADEGTLRMRHLRATVALGPVLAKIRGELPRLDVPDREIILLRVERDLSFAQMAAVRVSNAVRVGASFQAAMRRLGTRIAEPFHPLADTWPWDLLPAPPQDASA